MAKVRCPYCKEKIRTGATICKHCGSDVSKFMEDRQARTMKTFVGLLAVIGCLLVISWLTNIISPERQATQPKQQNFTQAPNPVTQIPQDEETALLNSYFGDYRKAKKVKRTDRISLKVWDTYIQYSKTVPFRLQALGLKGAAEKAEAVMLEGVQKLDVEYDEIWIEVHDEGFTHAQKRKFRGQFDIGKLYWKQNKIQAATVEKFYDHNLFTGERLSKPSHKIVNIYDRNYILKKLSEK